MTKDEALDLALEALEYIENNYMSLPKSGSEAITAIKQARSAPVQEPVAYRSRLASGSYTYCNTPQFFDNAEPLYTTPPAAQPAQEPVAFAGVEMWIGNTRIKKLMTQAELHFAIDPWAIVKFNSDSCIDALKEIQA